MSGRQCYSALAQGARTRPQAIRHYLSPRHETLRAPQRPFHISRPTLAESSLKPANPTPQSTPTDPTPKPTTPAPAAPTLQKFAQTLRTQGPTRSVTVPYAAHGTTELLFKSCSQAGNYSGTAPSSTTEATSTDTTPSTSPYNRAAPPQALKTAAGEDIFHPATLETWHGAYSLPPTFSTWSQLTILHLYLVGLRLRMFPAEHERRWSQQLLDHFFYAAEEKMDGMHAITSKGIRSRYLKDLFNTFRGSVVSYDEGFIKGDAELAAAVWRNVFAGRQDVDAVALAEIVGWMRRGARALGKMGDEEFVAGNWTFGAPWKGRHMVEEEAKGMRASSFVDEGKAGS